MTLPSKRKIVVGAKDYTWVIKNPSKDRYRTGWTYGTLVLTVRDEASGGVRQFELVSKKWSREHSSVWFDEEIVTTSRPHKVSVTPSTVAQIIQLEQLPAVVDTWKVSAINQ